MSVVVQVMRLKSIKKELTMDEKETLVRKEKKKEKEVMMILMIIRTMMIISMMMIDREEDDGRSAVQPQVRGPGDGGQVVRRTDREP